MKTYIRLILQSNRAVIFNWDPEQNPEISIGGNDSDLCFKDCDLPPKTVVLSKKVILYKFILLFRMEKYMQIQQR